MSQISTRSKKKVSLSNIATLLMVTSLAGQLLGFFRTKLIGNNFDKSQTDAFFAAFTIPDFFFYTLAAGALGVAFMPVLSDRFHRGDRKGVWDLSSSLINSLTLVMGLVGILMFVFADPIIRHVVGTGLVDHPDQFNDAVMIVRLISFNPLLFALSGVMTTIQQVMGRFFFYALAPLFYNLSIIFSVYVFKDSLGVVGLGVGALIGALAQLLIVGVGFFGLRFNWKPKIIWRSKDFRTVLKQLPPRSLDQGMDQVGNIIDTRIASGLGAGSISSYNFAYILHTAPILLIGTAISTAAFPRLTARLSQNRPDLFRKDFQMILRVIIWLILPIAVVSFYGRGYLARIINSYVSPEIATIFGFLVVAIIFRSIYAIMSRWFYAQKDTRTPLLVSVFTIGLNVALSITLARESAYGVVGLALAQSIVALVEVALLSSIMFKRDRRMFDAKFMSGCYRILAVTGFSLLAGFVITSYLPLGLYDVGFFTLGFKFSAIAAVILGVHVIMSWVFGLEEVKPLVNRLKKLVTKPIRYFGQP